jgi:hypothetical protein
MNFTAAEFRRLILPVAMALVLAGAGAALIWSVNEQLIRANATFAGVKKDRVQARERLARISEEEREVKERIEVYRRLRDLHIIGKERRLDWADAIQRIRVQREMLDVRYRIEPQKVLMSIPGKPGKVDFNVSAMRLELALLHEGDLLTFLDDLKNAGNAYVSVRRCLITRSGSAASPAGTLTLTPRLRAECQIDLITVLDAGAKA